MPFPHVLARPNFRGLFSASSRCFSKSTTSTTRTSLSKATLSKTTCTATDNADALPLDSLPRYPDSTALGTLRLLDYVGTVSFAHSGALLAATSGMDLLGAALVGTVTAIGGGTVRDGVVLNQRPFWTTETEYLYIALASAATTFGLFSLAPPTHGRVESAPEVAIDALSVGAFCVIGAQNGIRAGMSGIVCTICGMATATFGGLVRDVLCNREVRILHSTAEIYATTAVAGASSYMIARRMKAGVFVRVGIGIGTAFGLRMWAWKSGIRLPVWQDGTSRKFDNCNVDASAECDE